MWSARPTFRRALAQESAARLFERLPNGKITAQGILIGSFITQYWGASGPGAPGAVGESGAQGMATEARCIPGSPDSYGRRDRARQVEHGGVGLLAG